MKRQLTILLILVCAFANSLKAQDTDPMMLLQGLAEAPKDEPVIATFKATRVINQQTIEVGGSRSLDFRIHHHFGPFNSGAYDFWGIDGGASIRLGLEYSYDGRLQIGLGRTSYEKQLDGFLKYRLLRQSKSGSMPISVTLFSGAYQNGLKGLKIGGLDKFKYASDRFSFVHQVIIARKIDDKLSLQITPTMVHYNLVENLTDNNDSYFLGISGRYKISNRTAITYEYGARMDNNTAIKYYDSMGIGLDIETGGHVFQMFLTNSFGMTENQTFARTNTSWADRGFRLGFNVSRMFTL
ncbi:MAG: hypothetical protein RI934_1243 [Bacteroidota bacterium]|jgi:hypothetical protein